MGRAKVTAAVILAATLVFFSVVCLAQFGLRYVYSYSLGQTAIEFVLLGGIVIARIPYDSIAGVQMIPPRDTYRADMSTFRAGNRLLGDAIVIERNRGLVRRILITPDDGATFVANLRLEMKRAK